MTQRAAMATIALCNEMAYTVTAKEQEEVYKIVFDAMTAAEARGRREILIALFHDLFEGQTEAEWLAHARRFKGGSAESWTIGELIERAIRQRQAEKGV